MIKRRNMRFLALLTAIFCAACSRDEQDAIGKNIIRYCCPGSGLVVESDLESMASISKDLFQKNAIVLMDDPFTDLKPWEVVGEKNESHPYFSLITLENGDKALQAQSGACNKARMLFLKNRKPLIACLRVRKTPSITLERVSEFTGLFESKTRTSQGLATMNIQQVTARHFDWKIHSEEDGWMNLYQVLYPRATSVLIAPVFNLYAKSLEETGGIVVDRFMVREAVLTEATTLLASRPDFDLHDSGGEVRHALITSTPSKILLPIPKGEERLLRFGMAFPGTGSIGHAERVRLKLSLMGNNKKEQLLQDKEISVGQSQESLLPWLEQSCVIPPVSSDVRVKLECFSNDKAVIAWGSLILTPNKKNKKLPNVILVSIDTLRADKLGAYGAFHPAGLSPFIDNLAKDAHLFENAIAQAPYTLPSHVSMLSGQYPTVHTVEFLNNRVDHERSVFLSTRLQEQGYITGGYTGGGLVHHTFGFNQGFDSYFNSEPLKGNNMDRVLDWVGANGAAPYFLFFHTYSAHGYAWSDPEYLSRFDPNCNSVLHSMSTAPAYYAWLENKEEQKEEDFKCLENRYMAGVRMADDALKRLMEHVDLDNTLVVITSDHGEELLDRGNIQHGRTLYEELIHVPLIIRYPGGTKGRRIHNLVEVIDVAPTILEYLGLAPSEGVQGQSLCALMDPEKHGGKGFDMAFSELNSTYNIYALRTEQHKLIFNQKSEQIEFFDLQSDPMEKSSLPEKSKEAIQFKKNLDMLRKGLENLSSSLKSSQGEGAPIDSELMNQLRAMGYVK